jgi:hypothetical protein
VRSAGDGSPLADHSDATAPDGDAGARDAGEPIDPKCGPAVLCEDFESGPTFRPIWNQTGSFGNHVAEVQSSIVHRGRYALHIRYDDTDTGGGAIFVNETASFPALAHRLYGRYYLYLATVPNGHFRVSWTAFDNDPSCWPFCNGTQDLEISLGPLWNLQEQDTAFGSNPTIAAQAMQWTCVEWSMVQDPNDDANLNGDLWVDGVHVTSIGIPFQPMVQFSFLEMAGAHNGEIMDRYYDDLVLDTARVGCIP